MIWLNTLRRWFGFPEKPPATYGDTSILFVLQSNSPQTRAQISAATRISEDQLTPILEKLVRIGRIRMTFHHLDRYYWIIKAD
jgi:DNA-binding MarR family transcriptional regulator